VILRYTVPRAEDRTRLDDFLSARVGWLSRTAIRALIRAERCHVNGRFLTAGLHVREGDEVVFDAEESFQTAMQPEDLPLEILHEDDALIVVVKPAGMLTHPTPRVRSGTLANALSHHWNADTLSAENRDEAPAIVRPNFIHRLDKDVSGILVIGKTRAATRKLAKAFEARQVSKRYLAILKGEIEQAEAEITAPIGRTGEKPPYWRVSQSGQPAHTRIWRLRSGHGKSEVELEPVTGRTNQLRIHCAHIGHPIWGDDNYGAPKSGRLFLHAHRLVFPHPDGARMEFRSPKPRSFDQIWEGDPR
jgi:23S rRNA pseudouridine1911/1915/1917 synthase